MPFIKRSHAPIVAIMDAEELTAEQKQAVKSGSQDKADNVEAEKIANTEKKN
jgi:hypothetical protein